MVSERKGILDFTDTEVLGGDVENRKMCTSSLVSQINVPVHD